MLLLFVFFIYCDISKYEERSDFDKHLDKKKILRSMLSAIGKHLAEAHGRLGKPKESQFRILRNC